MFKRVLAILLTISMVACVKDPEDTTVHVTGVTLNTTGLELYPGTTYVLSATVSPSNATNKTVLWIIGNAKVATVSDGTVTAVGVGETTITAKSDDGGFTASCTVTVVSRIIPVTGVSLEERSITLSEGEERMLKAVLAPENATNSEIQWSSSNTSVAVVDGNGKVSAISKGTATISVTTADGGFTAQCEVNVAPRVTGIMLNTNSISLNVGNSETLVATVLPTEAINKGVVWSSSNTSIATVDNNGKVTAVSGGSATITAKTQDGGYSASCNVTVRVGVTSVNLDPTSMLMMPGDEKTITATVSPDNATNRNVSWTSSNESVAKYSNGKVLAIAEGTATITVTSEDGGFTATCKITVTNDMTRFVNAQYIGGSIMMNGSLILYGSKLNFKVNNNSSKQITVKSVQLFDGEDGSSTSVLSINQTIDASSNAAWSISVPLKGIHSPTAQFVCDCEGTEFTVSAKYKDYSF